jgi:hypothetical protein
MARKPHYVNNKDFYEAILKYKAALAENPNTRIPDYIGICITKICDKLSTRPNFSGYSFRDEMVADGMEGCIRAVHLFNPDKTNNPFAYFTQIAWNAFIRRIGLEKKEQYLKHKNAQHVFLSGSLADQSFGDTGAAFQLKENDISSDVIAKFEEKMLAKKKQAKIVGLEKFAEE